MSGGITSLEFTEKMRGRIGFGEADPSVRVRAPGPRRSPIMFRLTMEVMDVDRFVTDPMLEASARGYIRCEELGGQLPVERGIFNLFVDSGDGRERRMLYRLQFRDGAGNPLTLTGHKEVRNDPGFDLWSDTTTLYVRLLRGHVDAGADEDVEVVAAGIMRIRLLEFLRLLTTFRARGPHLRARARALTSFAVLFLGHLRAVYGPRAARRRAA
jgi:cholesterol oxidase